eukprot:768650-Hanusia_phi.AAC.9
MGAGVLEVPRKRHQAFGDAVCDQQLVVVPCSGCHSAANSSINEPKRSGKETKVHLDVTPAG